VRPDHPSGRTAAGPGPQRSQSRGISNEKKQ
jgi:hypothetical protein